MYNAQYFIDKFTAIPDERWTTETYMHYDPVSQTTKRCAMGHCGVNGGDEPLTEEARALYRMFSAYALSVADVNDGKNESVRQRTPKARVLFGLEYIQKLGG